MLYYRATFLLDGKQTADWPPAPEVLPAPILPEPITLAALAMIEQAQAQSADQITLAAQLMNALRSEDQQVGSVKAGSEPCRGGVVVDAIRGNTRT